MQKQKFFCGLCKREITEARHEKCLKMPFVDSCEKCYPILWDTMQKCLPLFQKLSH
jgi:hypothetical protein